MKVITISSRESGVGKSAVAVHLAHYLRGTGKSVAVIDLAYTDNTSRTLAEFAGSFTVPELFDGKARNPRRKHGVPRIELVRSNLREEMARWRRGEFGDPLESVFARFREGLACLAPTFDYCVVDTAPGLCVRARSAIVAADLVLVPVVSMPGAAEQMDRFFIELAVLHVQSRTTPKATLLLPNRFRSVKREARAAQEQLCRCFRHPTIETPIVESEEIQAALSKRMPIWALDTRSDSDAGWFHTLACYAEDFSEAEIEALKTRARDFHQAYWRELLVKRRDTRVVHNGRHFVLHQVGTSPGFGGRIFKVDWFDESRAPTLCNLSGQGKVPAWLRGEVPDNAVISETVAVR